MSNDYIMNAMSLPLACVIGFPVAHSLSPRLHGYWLRHYGIDGYYVPLEVQPEEFPAALRMLPKMGFAGGNVTVPHKEAALAAVDDASPLARRIGAVNTVIVRPDGSLYGDNTDAYGFITNLKSAAGNGKPYEKAVVIGAGGAARAVCTGLLDAGTRELVVINRTQARAETLAETLDTPGVAVVPWERRAAALEDAALLVNTTTLGMEGGASLELSLEALPHEALVTDIVYTPLETLLLAAARARGNPVVDGLGMLLHQAVPGFEAWFGRRPEVTETLREWVLRGG